MDDYRGVYVLMEKIKRSDDRVRMPKLVSTQTDLPTISGGYLFRKDKPSTDFSFTTPTAGIELQLLDPCIAQSRAERLPADLPRRL